jgi:phosphomannomutase / phosphoglucomutase
MDYNILRANDIRGEYPTEVNGDVAYKIGRAFASYLSKLNVNYALVGHDNRLSSDELSQNLINGLLNSGINVTDIGLVTTPIFNYASITKQINYGIMVTASHNKASDNGFKIFGSDYLHLSEEELQKLYKIIKEEDYVTGSGTLTKLEIKEDYINMLLSKFHKSSKKVVVDCGNGTGSIIVKEIFSKLLIDVTFINCESDGSFPIHNPDPNEEDNLRWLKSVVKLKKADLGIAVDGDCDRVGIVDEDGKMIPTDMLIGIFARDIIPNSDNKKVIIDVKCSCALAHDLKKIGAQPLMVKNGSAYLEKVIHDTPALIGGEYSGHIFFRDNYYGFDDGIYAGLRMISLLDKKKMECSKLLTGMEKYYNTPEIRVHVSDKIKYKVINKIKEYAKNQNYDCNFVDGVRVDYPDGFSLVRCSNTGPNITLRFEAKDEITLNNRQKEFTDLLNSLIK